MPHILDYQYTIPQGYSERVSKLIREEYMGNTKLMKGNTDNFIQVNYLFIIVWQTRV